MDKQTKKHLITLLHEEIQNAELRILALNSEITHAERVAETSGNNFDQEISSAQYSIRHWNDIIYQARRSLTHVKNVY